MKFIDSFLLHARPALLADWIKRISFFKRKLVDCGQGRFFVDTASNFGFQIAYSGVYEAGMTTAVTRILNPGDTFIDLGANEGFFSVVASRIVGPEGRVLAIEPQRRLLGVLTANLSLNNCFNTEIRSLAIGKDDSYQSFNLAPSTNTGSSGLVRPTKYPLICERVRVTTLGRMLANSACQKARLIKIDIEGGEWDAIFGSREIFSSHFFDYIALELHPSQLAKQGKGCQDIIDFLVSAGYAVDDSFETLIFRFHQS